MGTRRAGRQRGAALPYEEPYPWEDARGSTVDRTVEVSAEAKRVYAQQEQMLPTLTLDRPLGVVAAEHLQDVGRRVLLLRDTAKRSRKKEGGRQNQQQGRSPERVIPSRFPEVSADLDVGDAGEPDRAEEEEDPAITDGRITTMLMDQEWDTRAWNSTKVQSAVSTLYEEIEHSEDDSRRELATSMLLRLLETHEDAVDFVETTLPSLTNKAFRTLSKLTNNTKIFRIVRLVAVLAEWFARILSSENAAGKSVKCLLRETELCARILQHHWRGVLFERSLQQRDADPVVRTRLRSMHLVKFVELRHQFRVFREAVGGHGIPHDVTQAYVTILYHVVKRQREVGVISDKMRYAVLSDQQRVLGSGALVYLSSLITRQQRREVVELVKRIVSEIAEGHGDQIAEILHCNIVERVKLDLNRLLQARNDPGTVGFVASSLDLLSTVSSNVLQAVQRWGNPVSGLSETAEERRFLLRKLKKAVRQFLLTADVFDTLFQTLQWCRKQHETLRAQVLDILCLLARSAGFPQLLDALTRCGGRWFEQLAFCMIDDSSVVVRAAVALFYELTSRADARNGLTAAGAVQIFLRWCPIDLEGSGSQSDLVMGLIGCTLLARQSDRVTSATSLLDALDTPADRLDALYTLLLALATEDETTSRASERSAMFFFSNDALPTLTRFLAQVTPSCMASPDQNARQRSVSCIIFGRFCKASAVARACFSEDVVNHLALALQCNRLDEIEGLVTAQPADQRFVHHLGSLEACKALSRLARCPSTQVDARLRPSLTSSQVPEWPQALICDVLFRFHVLEDVIALIRSPSDATEFPDLQVGKVTAAVELAGYLRSLPYGESARESFLKTRMGHPQGQYAQQKLQQLVTLIAPAILRILREKNLDFELVSCCCMTLSRLACTNAACSLLLTQGCLQTALVHLPELLNPNSSGKTSPQRRNVRFAGSVDDHGLLDVPAALYTLLGKLCAVSEGREGLMKAHVLPRLLKRLQLRHQGSKAVDDECKSEIAVVITRLAMVNAIEGNTSELFLHFRVLELLVTVLQEHCGFVPSSGSPTTVKIKEDVKTWRLLSHALGAIAALSQDVLVCVPRVVELDVLELLSPYLARLGRESASNPHLEALQYHSVTIVRAIASYPFGEYHPYLVKAKGGGKATSTVMERVKQIGFDFKMELQNKPMATRDRKTVGELARDTLAFLNEQQQRRKSRVSDTGPVVKAQSLRKTEQQTHEAFPALPQSPSARSEHEMKTRRFPAAKKPPVASETPLNVVIPAVLVIDGGSKSPVCVNGVDLASTRPPGSEKPQIKAHYVFTRPKSTTKKERQDFTSCLMLDPLFQSTSTVIKTHEKEQGAAEDDAVGRSFPFSQELDRFGHCVSVKASRSKPGDRYFPSLGRILLSDPNAVTSPPAATYKQRTLSANSGEK
ncbi:hypothetical protein BBJ28_00018819 [Nothophytophthora sp. Chile5]|nr:hypothetical protein BBJ28_00018819 [Nothophytophthora sp. Chile5]